MKKTPPISVPAIGHSFSQGGGHHQLFHSHTNLKKETKIHTKMKSKTLRSSLSRQSKAWKNCSQHFLL
jgi:hypothetical protein